MKSISFCKFSEDISIILDSTTCFFTLVALTNIEKEKIDGDCTTDIDLKRRDVHVDRTRDTGTSKNLLTFNEVDANNDALQS
jgi:hypothetical protein